MDAGRIYQISAFARWSLKRLLSVSAAATGCSQYVLSDAANQYDLPPITKVIYNGIDFSEQCQKSNFDIENKKYILTVGRLVPQKGFDLLLHSFQMLADKHEDTFLVIAGDGTERQRLENLATELKISRQVLFTGFLDRGAIYSLFNHCLFYVLPSIVEPFGIVSLEAMRSGKPVIAFNCGGPSEYIEDRVNGLLVEPSNILKLSQAISTLLDDPSLTSKLGQAALNHVAYFTWANVTNQYEQIYQAIKRS